MFPCRFCGQRMKPVSGESSQQGHTYEFECTNPECSWHYRENLNMLTLVASEEWYRRGSVEIDNLDQPHTTITGYYK